MLDFANILLKSEHIHPMTNFQQADFLEAPCQDDFRATCGNCSLFLLHLIVSTDFRIESRFAVPLWMPRNLEMLPGKASHSLAENCGPAADCRCSHAACMTGLWIGLQGPLNIDLGTKQNQSLVSLSFVFHGLGHFTMRGWIRTSLSFFAGEPDCNATTWTDTFVAFDLFEEHMCRIMPYGCVTKESGCIWVHADA